jgi:DNA-binding transcriptional LysR family regulator
MTMPDEMDFHLITDDEPSVIVMRSDHRLACEPPDRPIQLADLAEDAWVLPRRTSSQGHEYVTETCHEHGFEPKIRHSVENWPMALMLIRDGAIAWSQAGTTLLFRDDPDYTWRWLADGVLVCRHWIGWHRESFVSDHGARLIASVHADHESFRANWPNRPTPGRDPINSTWQTNEEPTPEWLS